MILVHGQLLRALLKDRTLVRDTRGKSQEIIVKLF
jgi:hypothetical protein